MKTVTCFFHSADLDGRCSGAIVREWAALRGAELFTGVPVNHGEDPDWLCGAGPGSVAVIVDFCPEGDPAPAFAAMQTAYSRVIWIDHHQTSIERAAGLDIEGRRVNGTAACALAWAFFFGGRATPRTVRAVAACDVFERCGPIDFEAEALPFTAGLGLEDTDPSGSASSYVWGPLLNADGGATDTFYAAILDHGRLIMRYRERQNLAIARDAYETIFDGRPCIAANASGNSLALKSAARPRHEMIILWRLCRAGWRVSLYENGRAGTDCAAAAAARGGGGHKGAAGFILPPGANPVDIFPRIGGGK
jgi:hypothetical protein